MGGLGPIVTAENLILRTQVRELWGLGMTAGIICVKLGVTRNTVMGHITRMGLTRKRGAAKIQVKRVYRPRTPKFNPETPSSHVAIASSHTRMAQFRARKTPELSKESLRRQLTDAVQNTAKLPKIGFLMDSEES